MKMLKICGKILLIVAIILVVILLVAWLFLRFYPSVGKTPDKTMQERFAEESELYYDGQFHNENEFSVMTGDAQKASDRCYPKETVPSIQNTDIQRSEEGSLTTTWYGHSSVLVQLGSSNVFIDPVL